MDIKKRVSTRPTNVQACDSPGFCSLCAFDMLVSSMQQMQDCYAVPVVLCSLPHLDPGGVCRPALGAKTSCRDAACCKHAELVNMTEWH